MVLDAGVSFGVRVGGDQNGGETTGKHRSSEGPGLPPSLDVATSPAVLVVRLGYEYGDDFGEEGPVLLFDDLSGDQITDLNVAQRGFRDAADAISGLVVGRDGELTPPGPDGQ